MKVKFISSNEDNVENFINLFLSEVLIDSKGKRLLRKLHYANNYQMKSGNHCVFLYYEDSLE